MSRTPSSYHLRATLTQGGRWQGTITELPEVHPTMRSLSQLETRVRTEIAQGEGLDPEALALEVTHHTGDDALDADAARVRELKAGADQLAEQARRAAEDARTAAAPVARRLLDLGASVRDAGAVLGGYSGSYIHNLTQSN
ncbi:hypothetical protein GCM10009801_73050 [Streptomyces albiaxialis]|uniref:Regulatory protein n=1 Tax=Streptomyces albiaxialis TaxID=329523 RepID=A0ABN2WX44_9ACTN